MPSVEGHGFELTYSPVIIGSFLILSFIYKWLSPRCSAKLVPTYETFSWKDKRVWNFTVASMCHVAVVNCICVYVLLFEEGIRQDHVWYDSPLVRIECAVLTGYVFVDIIDILRYDKLDLENCGFLLHHISAAIGYTLGMGYGLLSYFCNIRMMAELSTPFLNIKFFMDILKVEKTSTIFLLNGVLLTLAFICVRIGPIPFCWYAIYQLAGTTDMVKIGSFYYIMIAICVALDSLNIFWARKMVLGIIKLLKTKETRKTIIIATDIKMDVNSNSVKNAPLNGKVKVP